MILGTEIMSAAIAKFDLKKEWKHGFGRLRFYPEKGDCQSDDMTFWQFFDAKSNPWFGIATN